MYDDTNEFFWSREGIDRLLPQGDSADKQSFGLNATLAYSELRTKLREAAESKRGLGTYFQKTFLETVSVPAVLYVFSRILIMHAVAWHLCIVLSFAQSWTWQHLCIPTLTHSVLTLGVKKYEMTVSRHIAGKRRWRRLTLFVYSSGTVIFIFDRLLRNDPRILLFQLFAFCYT